MVQTTNKDLWEGETPISIRREDINSAILDKKHCPVWFAMKRILPQEFQIKVLRTTIQIFPKKGNKGMYGKLPDTAILFGKMWDNDDSVKPFVFSINFRI